MLRVLLCVSSAAATLSCVCSPFSGNLQHCCAGSQNTCSSDFHNAGSCNGSTPVCCNSDFGAVCCSTGSTCSAGCRDTLFGGCECKNEPTAASVGYNVSAALHVLAFNAASQCDAAAIVSWNCTACPASARLASINVTAAGGHLAYVGYDKRTGRVAVVLRGSLSIEDWLDNLDFGKVGAYEKLGCSGCYVHHGFLLAFQALQPGVEASIDALHARYPHAPISITGHSLGGAMAVHAAIALTERNLTLDPTIYTFGQYAAAALLFDRTHPAIPAADNNTARISANLNVRPRVGDDKFVAWFTSRFASGPKRWFRAVHWNDPVPHVPPHSLGFHHVGREMWCAERARARAGERDTWKPHGTVAREQPCELTTNLLTRFLSLPHVSTRCALPPLNVSPWCACACRYDESSKELMICAAAGEDHDCSNSAAVALKISDHFTYLGHPVVHCQPFLEAK